MVSPIQEARKDGLSSASSDDGTLDELRNSVASIADDFKKVVEARGQAAKEQAQDGVKALRKGIRRQPALAMAIATAAGAVLAVIAVPRFGHRLPSPAGMRGCLRCRRSPAPTSTISPTTSRAPLCGPRTAFRSVLAGASCRRRLQGRARRLAYICHREGRWLDPEAADGRQGLNGKTTTPGLRCLAP